MFASLGLDRVVCRHGQQGQVDARRTGQHVADKPFVARHVDNTQPHVAQGKLGEPELDGDAPLLFLRQSVGIGTGQRPGQGGLAVIDVPCRPEDQIGYHG